MEINKRMFSYMDEKHIKMADLAKYLGINKTVVSSWKSRGTNPPAEFIVQICELLDITIEMLITGEHITEISQEEQKILDAYRLADQAIRIATKKLLDVPEQYQEKSSTSRTG